MKIWHISDTHGFHRGLPNLKGIDLVIHSGDVSNAIDPAINTNEVLEFLDWFQNLDAPTKILVPGNHDTSIFTGHVSKEQIEQNGVELVINQTIFVQGIKIWGSPYSPKINDAYTHWAWGLRRNEMDKVWKLIPEQVDILVTHGPPKGILDLTMDRNDDTKIVQCGDAILYNRIQDIRPAFHLFGHIHDEKGFRNFGLLQRGFTKYSNGSCAGRSKMELCNGGNVLVIQE